MAATLTRRTGGATTPAERLPQTQEKRYDAGEQALDGDHILSRPGRSLKGKYQYDRKQRFHRGGAAEAGTGAAHSH